MCYKRGTWGRGGGEGRIESSNPAKKSSKILHYHTNPLQCRSIEWSIKICKTRKAQLNNFFL